MDRHAKEIETLANQISTSIDAGVTIQVSMMETLKNGDKRDKFTVEADFEDGTNEYSMSSGGESVRVDLCVTQALKEIIRHQICDLNVEVFDEAYSDLDDVGKEEFIKIVHKLAEKRKIFLITHDQSIKSSFQNVLTVVKKGKSAILVDPSR